MSQWQIDEVAVQSILLAASDAQMELSAALAPERMQVVFDGLATGGAVTSRVATAMSNLLADQQGNLESIGNCVNAGIAGVGNATIAYKNGQEDMIGQFQSELAETAVDGDFSFFDEHGYPG